MKMKRMILLGMIPFLFLACSVQQTEEGELPDVDVDVEPGNMPEYDVDTMDVEVGTEEETITVPKLKVDMEEETITTPTIDVDMPGDDED
jgi:hypothetical protein